MKLAIIGTGIMGTLIKDALLKKKLFSAKDLNFVGRDDKTPDTDLYLFAVKPQDFQEASKRLKGKKNKIIISIMAGVPTAKISKFIPGNKVVRSIPNLGAKTSDSMTVWMTKSNLKPKEKSLIKNIFQAIGVEIEVKSDDMVDKATPLAGSGPGFLYFIADQMVKTAKKFGFKEGDSEQMIKQMFIGTAKAWENSDLTAKEMQEKVTSKKGTTLAGIENFKKNKLPQVLEKGLKASYKRAKELSK